MERSDRVTFAALAFAVVALIVSVAAYAGRPRTIAPAARATPTTVRLSMVVATFSGQGVAAHRWYPTTFFVRRGDTVDLAIANPDRFSHEFALDAFNLRSKVLAPGGTDHLSFVADQPGVFPYYCMLPYDPAKGHCTPDHDLMLGYLIVTE